MNLALLLLSSLVSAPHHYVLVFAHQDSQGEIHPRLKSVHSFATFVEVDDHAIRDQFTVSWVGAGGNRPWSGRQYGRNDDLPQSLADARRHGWHVSMWGPYLTTETAYRRARRQYERLEQAESDRSLEYCFFGRDLRLRSAPACHCVQALTEIAGGNVRLGVVAGVEASKRVVAAYRQRGVIVGLDPQAEWIWDELGKESGSAYAVTRRRADVPIITSPYEESSSAIVSRDKPQPRDASMASANGSQHVAPSRTEERTTLSTTSAHAMDPSENSPTGH